MALFVTDLLDGKLARAWKVQTRGGSLLDPFGDKLLAISCIMSFIGTQNFFLVPLFLEIGITLINVNRTLHEETVSSSIIGKIKTCILSMTIVLCAINVLSPEILNTFILKFIPSLSELDLTITDEVVNIATVGTIAAQVLTAGGYVKQSIQNRDERTKKIAELKSLKEMLIRLFDEEAFEEDKDKPLMMIIKK